MFVFIIPPEFRQITGADLDLLDPNAVINFLATQDYVNLSDRMRELGFINADESVVEARLFDSVIFAYRI
jgi:hypothetical protein